MGLNFCSIAKIGQVTRKYKEHRTELTKLKVVNLKETGLLDRTSIMIANFVLSVVNIFLNKQVALIAESLSTARLICCFANLNHLI